jgi:DNA (cytosine-5)-methyltransferase 3A
MNVLSLFDGISCARVALDRAGLPVKTYWACEIDKHAIKVSAKNYPDILHLGDVREVTSLPEPIDLLIGGSPCTDLSIAKKNRQGLAGEHSSLFWEYVRLWELLKPRWFILENVASMPKADRDIITETLGVEPILIDAALVSAQSRKRLFWTNLPTSQPADRGLLLRDILEPDAEVDESFTIDGKSFCLTATYHKVGTGDAEADHNRKRKQRTMVLIGRVELRRLDENGVRHDGDASYPLVKKITARENGGKSNTLTTLTEHNLVVGASRIRKLTPVECERLQGLPDGYTEGVAKTHRYKALGNAFNVDVVAHLLSTLS